MISYTQLDEEWAAGQSDQWVGSDHCGELSIICMRKMGAGLPRGELINFPLRGGSIPLGQSGIPAFPTGCEQNPYDQFRANH
jgi:hypothetical protein